MRAVKADSDICDWSLHPLELRRRNCVRVYRSLKRICLISYFICTDAARTFNVGDHAVSPLFIPHKGAYFQVANKYECILTLYWILMFIYRIVGLLDFLHRPVFYRIENTTFRKLDLFSSSDEGGRRHLHSWAQWLRLALSKEPNWVGVYSHLHLRTETDPVSESSCFLFSRIPDDGKSPKTQ
jgi:hypothetical protein